MKLLEQVRNALRVKHYSYRTEQCYVAWIEQFIRCHRTPAAWQHPDALGPADVERFLTYLAVIGACRQARRIRRSAPCCSCIATCSAGKSAPSTPFALAGRYAPTGLSRTEVATPMPPISRAE